MEGEVDLKELEQSRGRRVEVIAFDLAYAGELREVNLDQGIVRIIDGEDLAVIEIERIQSFRVVE